MIIRINEQLGRRVRREREREGVEGKKEQEEQRKKI